MTQSTAMAMDAGTARYTMTISRLTVDKLGVKLYDRASAVLAELVANSYDASATEVKVTAPMGRYLAVKEDGRVRDLGYIVEVSDDGVGMTPEEVNKFYLRVGAERRKDPKRGDTSRRYGRKVMGRKGVGKLAPFGICQKIEVLTSGGEEPVEGKDENGNDATGYVTAHLFLDRNKILKDSDFAYEPEVGPLDGLVRPKTGTTLRLTLFARRKVPDIEALERQMSQRFGVATPKWKILLIDSDEDEETRQPPRQVGGFAIPKMENTEIRFVDQGDAYEEDDEDRYVALNPDDTVHKDLQAGFEHEGAFYPVTGWVAYSKEPYKDDLMAGVRIYCRGKIAAQTGIFNRKAGFTGEHDVRSYLVGEVHADWLDDDEDLIQTDRRDILWSHDLGQAFEEWGQSVVLRVGKAARNPVKKKTWDRFKELSDVEEKVRKAFPLSDQGPIRDRALEYAQMVGKNMRTEELKDEEQVETVVQLSLFLAPHITLDEELRKAADSEDSPVAVISGILRTARIAQLASFGRIAEDRIKVIARVEELKDDSETLEAAFQDLIEEAPWLINPQWSPLTENQTFSTLKTEFEKYFEQHTGEPLDLGDFTDPTKRSDFVLSNQDRVIQIIEIKRPHHKFANEEMVRLDRYNEQMTNFLADPRNAEFKRLFDDFHITLVCDEEKLTGVHKRAYEGLVEAEKLTPINWRTFLLRTRRSHEEFLEEVKRHRRDAARVV